VFAGCVVGGWLLVSRQLSLNQQKTKVSKEAMQAKIIDKAKSDVEKIIAGGGDVKDAVLVYDSAIKATDEDSVKSTLLINKSNLYYNKNDYDIALAAALESEQINNDENTEQYIAQLYYIKGDKQNAVKYLEKAVESIDHNSPFAKADIQDYRNRINMINGSSS
jgi:tetratricopeptide (TPR) repeat protein